MQPDDVKRPLIKNGAFRSTRMGVETWGSGDETEARGKTQPRDDDRALKPGAVRRAAITYTKD